MYGVLQHGDVAVAEVPCPGEGRGGIARELYLLLNADGVGLHREAHLWRQGHLHGQDDGVGAALHVADHQQHVEGAGRGEQVCGVLQGGGVHASRGGVTELPEPGHDGRAAVGRREVCELHGHALAVVHVVEVGQGRGADGHGL